MCDYVLFRFKNIMTLALGPASQKPATKDPQSKYETARDYKNHLKGVSQDRELEEWFQDCLRCLLIFISWQDLILTFFLSITLNHRAQHNTCTAFGRPNLLWTKMVMPWPSIGSLGKAKGSGQKRKGNQVAWGQRHNTFDLQFSNIQGWDGPEQICATSKPNSSIFKRSSRACAP